jgi:hypothetical protein
MEHCYICGRPRQAIHHCLHGTANRKHADRLKLVIPICFECHQGANGIHNNRKLDLRVIRCAQRKFEEKLGTREDFIRIFGKNYLED